MAEHHDAAGVDLMRERPILFGAPMVRALLDGKKTQTRRIVKPQPEPATPASWHPPGTHWWPSGKAKSILTTQEMAAACPYGSPGDRLWVKEAHARVGEEVVYRWDWAICRDVKKWRSPIHMRRADSRITLEVVGVRVQRLHDITEEDAKAEGVEPVRYDPEGGDCWTASEAARLTPHRVAFEYAWNEIHGWTPAPAWDANPFVWAISFKRVTP